MIVSTHIKYNHQIFNAVYPPVYLDQADYGDSDGARTRDLQRWCQMLDLHQRITSLPTYVVGVAALLLG